MFSIISVGRNAFFVHVLLTLCSIASAQTKNYWCSRTDMDPGPEIPNLPDSYTMRAEVNYDKGKEGQSYVTNMVRSVDMKNRRESIELWAGTRHVRYISLVEEDAFINIVYTQNGPSCTTSKLTTTDRRKIYTEKSSGPLGILQVLIEEVFPKKDKFFTSESDNVRGMREAPAWEMCDYVEGLDKVVKVTLYYTDPTWIVAYQNNTVPTQILMRIRVEGQNKDNPKDKISLVFDMYSFEPGTSADKYFQIPEEVHCPRLSRIKSVPSLPNYFSYQAEKLIDQPKGSFVILHSKVYYDYLSKLIRVDSQDTTNKDSDSDVAQSLSTVMDFNAGIKYTINSVLGSCDAEDLRSSMNFLAMIDGQQDMLDPEKFFSMNEVNYSYIGEYQTRGMAADVFSGSVATHDNKNLNYFWYFTPDRTKLIEDEVEKNVLVKVVSRPQSLLEKKSRTEINFYNFNSERPSPFVFDISACYNETQSKTYMITFPGKDNAVIEKYAFVLQYTMHKALTKKAGVSPQRISMQKITFGENYFFVQFKILQKPQFGKYVSTNKENDLSKAESEIRNAVSNSQFKVSLRTKQYPVVRLTAEPDGFKEFKEEKKEITFNESSVAGLCIGMTVLGFLLGGVVVNLIFTKKYGVSLLQKTVFGDGARTLENPLNEMDSSI